MPLLGAHRATVGGLPTAFASADGIGAEVMQVFTSSPLQWAARPLTDQVLDDWQQARSAATCQRAFSHSAYLLNLASADDQVRERSERAYLAELERSQALGLEGVVLHPGSHRGAGEEGGLRRVATSLRSIYEQHAELTVPTLLETTAGSGDCLGARFEHLAWLIAAVGLPERTRVCLDTCHSFAAGYDLRDAGALAATLAEFERVIGLDFLALLHLNDSKTPRGSRVDRHERIGRGHLGDAAFAALLAEPRLASLPMVVETPELENHAEELAHLRALASALEEQVYV